MERVLELLQQFLQNKALLIVLLLLLIVSIFMLLKKNKHVKNLEEQIAKLEVDYNTIKSMPLTFKLNKARSLSKVNDVIEKDIDSYVESYETIQKAIERMDTLFADASDAVEVDELEMSQTYVDEISSLVTITLKNVTKLNEKLDSVLEQELKLRSEVTSFKERFRAIREVLHKRSGVLNFSEEVIEEYTKSAENEFSAFDEWMYISEFDKAEASLEKIDSVLKKLDEMLNQLPELLPVAKEIIPNKIANVSSLYSEVLDSNLYVDNLDVTQALSVISESLSTDLSDLRSGQVDKVKKSLDSSNKNLDELANKLTLELKSNENLVNLNTTVKESLVEIVNNQNHVADLYEDLSSRYVFNNFKEVLEALDKRVDNINKEHISICDSFKKKMPVSKMLEELTTFNDKLVQLKLDIEKLRIDIDAILSEEKRANQQLLKLYLIINEVSVKINEHQIPSISNDYQSDVELAKQHITNIENILSEDTLNTSLLNSTLTESIDYIYKLYNNVNNIVGMALMVENAIVFANRYRTNSPMIDSELSKGELYFRNGEYTHALTTVLAVIERIHPDDYEAMIRENSIDAL